MVHVGQHASSVGDVGSVAHCRAVAQGGVGKLDPDVPSSVTSALVNECIIKMEDSKCGWWIGTG